MVKTIIILYLFLIGISVQCQSLDRSITAPSGNYFYGAGKGSLSFTLGENAVTTLISSDNILTQGFQQPDSSKISFLPEKDGAVTLNIYPNPVSGFLTCKISGERQFRFVIYDETGRLINVQVISNDHEWIIDVQSLPAGAYTLTIADEQQKFNHSIKFIKL